MKYDKKIRELVRKLNNETQIYLDYTTSMNENAHTDRKLEYIIAIAKKIESLNYTRFNYKKDTTR